MALTPHDLARVAQLARLRLDPAHAHHSLAQINGFFELVAQLEAVDTSEIEPLAHPAEVMGDVALRLGEDRVSETDARAANMQNAPAVAKGLFLVPKVIE